MVDVTIEVPLNINYFKNTAAFLKAQKHPKDAQKAILKNIKESLLGVPEKKQILSDMKIKKIIFTYEDTLGSEPDDIVSNYNVVVSVASEKYKNILINYNNTP